MSTSRMIQVAMAIAIVFVQEQILMFIPNVQFTVVLLFVFASYFSLKENFILIFGYVLLDNMFLGGFNLFVMIPMLLAWSLIPLTVHVVLKKTRNEVALAFIALLFGFIYGWMFIPFNMLQYGVHTLWPYLLADLPFELIMSMTGFITVLWVYRPLLNLLEISTNQRYIETKKVRT